MHTYSVVHPVQAVEDLRLSQYLVVAGYVLLIYDMLLTLDREKRYIWSAKWTLGKALYLLVRWPLLLDTTLTVIASVASTPSPKVCKYIQSFDAVFSVLEVGVIHFIFAVRTYAIYDKDKRIGAFTISLNVLSAGATLAILLTAPRIRYVKSDLMAALPTHTGCYEDYCTDCSEFYVKVFWVPLICFDLVIFTMTVYKAWVLSHEGIGAPPIMKLILRDGILYFFAVFACELVNLILLAWLRRSLSFIAVVMLRSVIAIMACRLILNVRGTILARSDGSENFDPEAESRFEFRLNNIDSDNSETVDGTPGQSDEEAKEKEQRPQV